MLSFLMSLTLETHLSLVEFQFSFSGNQKAGIRLLPCFCSKMEASGIVATSFSSSCSCSASLWIFHLCWQRVTNFTRIKAANSTVTLLSWLPLYFSYPFCVIPEKGKDQASRFLSLKDLVFVPETLAKSRGQGKQLRKEQWDEGCQ